jgi:hypothetical protein
MTKKIKIDEELLGNLSAASSQISKALEQFKVNNQPLLNPFNNLQAGQALGALTELSTKIGENWTAQLKKSPLINLKGMASIPPLRPQMSEPPLGDWYQEPKRLLFEVIIEE